MSGNIGANPESIFKIGARQTWGDSHTGSARRTWADSHAAAAPGKVGGFPHSTGARQGGRIPTRHRRPAWWADF
ncbi:hypothetical protein E3N91_22805, partial [Salmonella enterica subsp. enterica serovar Braenderup]|nr:hypothetical protein [Salmonella enterica subsp. enterica serovar Braenderup]